MQMLKRMMDAAGDAAAVFDADGLGGATVCVELLCKFFCNIFTICDPELKPLAIGPLWLVLGGSLVWHVGNRTPHTYCWQASTPRAPW